MQNTFLSCATSTNNEGGHKDTKHILVMCDQHKQRGRAQPRKTKCYHVRPAETKREGTTIQNSVLPCATSTNKGGGHNNTKLLVILCNQHKQRGRAQRYKTHCYDV